MEGGGPQFFFLSKRYIFGLTHAFHSNIYAKPRILFKQARLQRLCNISCLQRVKDKG